MHFVSRSEVLARFEGKNVAVVGSGPGVLDNEPGFVDGHNIVVRVNNYRLSQQAGQRTDVYYSFFGNSIRKTVEELKRDGVTLCMCKCPDAHTVESEWHRTHDKMIGVDFRWIYRKRAPWWFCDTFIPSKDEFLATFELLGRHIPTTGFAAIIDVLSFNPRKIYLTGFDFFRSGLHNVNEPWSEKNNDDPIGHVPERELAWLVRNALRLPIMADQKLTMAMENAAQAA